jgi:hypothetical protein
MMWTSFPFIGFQTGFFIVTTRRQDMQKASSSARRPSRLGRRSPSTQPAVVPVRGAQIQPAAHGAVGHPDLLGQLADLVEHREQARGADDDAVGRADAGFYYCGSQDDLLLKIRLNDRL